MAEIISAVGGSLAGGALQYGANRNLAIENRLWQERMSNTAYRRAMYDMRAAGLNPMLAYSQGGASTPGGSSASINAPDIVGALSTAKQMQRTDADIDTAKTQQALNVANTGKSAAETDLSIQQNAESAARQAKIQAEIDKIRPETRSASARAYQDEEDERMRRLAGPKSGPRDALETSAKLIEQLRLKLGQFNVTPRQSSKADRPTDVGRNWKPGRMGDPNPGSELDVFGR